MSMSIGSYDCEDIYSAFEKICLIADRIWAINPDDMYRKLNEDLWVQNYKWLYEDLNIPNKKNKDVRDIIPNSLLAQYGNYEYDVQRESLYSFSEEMVSLLIDDEIHLLSNPATKLWTSDNVEDNSHCLISQITPSIEELKNPSEVSDNDFTESTTNVDEYDDKYRPMLYTVDNTAELQVQNRIFNDGIKCLWDMPDATIKALNDNYVKNSVQFHYANDSDDQQPNQINLNHPEPRNNLEPIKINSQIQTNQKPTVLPLPSPVVPEFYPKNPREMYFVPPVPVQYWPPFENYKQFYPIHGPPLVPLLPTAPVPNYNFYCQSPRIPLVPPPAPILTPLITPPYPWIPRIVPRVPIQIPPVYPMPVLPIPQPFTPIQPICNPVIHNPPPPIMYHNKPIFNRMPAPIPVYQRPVELYSDHRRKPHGVDFNNLILLTKGSMKNHPN